MDASTAIRIFLFMLVLLGKVEFRAGPIRIGDGTFGNILCHFFLVVEDW